MIRICKANELSKSEIFSRTSPLSSVEEPVRAIISEVRARGDEALFAYTARFDVAVLSSLAVSKEELDAAEKEVGEDFLCILKEAASRIRRFHEKQARAGFMINDEEGVIMGQKVVPLEKVGLYVPGGTAAYPSTVLMDAIPAKIAGCPHVVMVTPPRKDGSVSPAILAAAKVAGVDVIFKIGGAQAIAALAYGTGSVPAVDKIVGPGNAYVAEAKKQVSGTVGIDMIAGPSEILIVSDGSGDPKVLAADLLSQAEHDRNASAVLVTTDEALARRTSEELEKQIPLLARAKIARASIDNNGKIIVTGSVDEAIGISNELAPEHLELCLDMPFDYLDRVKNAGSVFLGKNCPEALGDYMAGPNHTLPTGGTARFCSPLSVDDFVKKMQYTYFTGQALARLAPDVAAFARREGLTGHARSALIRTEENE
ncbi:MAG: histidinol dehydrogenase [Clostridia bacterium]|nr:histidinol dehydrogenase [Clostridia bacterium]